ncbi:ribokinase [Rhodococcus aerolatus]
MTGRVVVVGSLNADLTVRVARLPRPGETLTGSELVVAPGGKSANQAVAAAVLGATVCLVGAVGDDEHAALLLDRARESGVDVTGVVRLAGTATGTAVIVVDDAGENTIVVSPAANGRLTPEHVSDAGLTADDVLCLCLEVPAEVVLAAARAARDVGARVLLNPSPPDGLPDGLLELADVLVCNAGEAEQLLGGGDWAGVRDAARASGVATTVVTLGGDGAVVLADEVTAVPTEAVDVVDTTGCGDAFLGVLAARLAAGDDVLDGSRTACRAASLAAGAAGAQSSYDSFARLRG